MVDQGLQVRSNGAELGRADVEGLPGGLRQARSAHDRVHKIFDPEELVPVVTLAQNVDAAPFADPVEQDLEDTEPLGPDERLRPDDRRLDGCDPAERLGVDLRLAVPADSDEGVVLFDRMLLGHAVDRGGRDEDHSTDAGFAGDTKKVLRAPDVDRANRLARGLDRQRRRSVHDDVGTSHELADARGVAHVAPELLHGALELCIVERHHVEGTDVVAVGEEPSREMQAQEPCAAGDSPKHQCLRLLTAGGVGAGRAGGFASTSTAAASSTAMPTMLSPRRLRWSRPRSRSLPRATAGTATSLCSPPHASARQTRPIFTSSTSPPIQRQAAERCAQSASSDFQEEPASAAEWPDSESPEANARPRTKAGHRNAARSVSQARKRSAATSAKPSVIAMNAVPKRVRAIGERSP